MFSESGVARVTPLCCFRYFSKNDFAYILINNLNFLPAFAADFAWGVNNEFLNDFAGERSV